MDKKKVVIIGAGFAGLNLAKRLDRKKYSVEIIDRNNFHSFPPLFYQIASSGLDADDISFPVRRELRHLSDTSFHMGHISEVDPVSKTVTTDKKKTSYDILVIAAGSVNNYFGNEKLAHSAFGIKTVNEAMRTRDQILENLEKASLCDDPRRRRQLLTFVVVGGGPTGVEIAGALGEMKKYVVPREYPELNPDDVSIKLMEGSDRILGAMGGKCSEHARHDLESLLVEMRTGTIIKDYSDKTVTFADGSTEYCETIIWSAGIKGTEIPGLDASCIGHGGRILTDRYHRVEGYDDIHAIGDIALIRNPESPAGDPQTAPAAIQHARNLARNLNHPGKAKPFSFCDKGSMATIGKHRAVVNLRGFRFAGFLAWILWMTVHLMSLMGMRNKFRVLTNWIWSYFSYSNAIRLILEPTRYPLRRLWGD